jgi:Cu/Ag efflux pump CusA
VVVWGAPAVRHTPSNVADLVLDVPGGGHVRLGDVANVQIGPYPTVIKHDNVSRSLDVAASVRGRDLATVVDEVRARVHAMAMPLEFHAEVHSDTLQKQGLFWRVGGAALAAALAIFLLLQAAFSSWRLAAFIFLVLPLSTVGGVLTASFVGGVRSLGALMGLLAVFGVAARNAVLLVKELGRHTPADAESVDRIVRDRAGSICQPLTMVAAVLPLCSSDGAGTEALLFAVVGWWSCHVDALLSRARLFAVPPGRSWALPTSSRRFAVGGGCDAALDWLAGHGRRSRRPRPHRLRFEGIE